MAKELIRWQAVEHHYRDKSRDWYLAVGIVTVLTIIGALLLKNILLAIVLLLGGASIILHGSRPPRLSTFGLTKEGVRINSDLFPYNHLNSFWIHEDRSPRIIMIHSQKVLHPHLIIPLPEVEGDGESERDEDLELIRGHLTSFLPEEEQEPSVSEVLADWLGL